MFLGTVSVCLTVLVLNIHHRDSERPVPKWLRILCFKYLARILCVVGRKPKSLAELERRVDDETHPRSRVPDGLHSVVSMYIESFFDRSRNFNGNTTSNDTSPSNDGTNNNQEDFLLPQNGANHNNNTANGYVHNTGPLRRRRNLHNNAYEWKEVAHILDKLFFIVVFLCMSTSLLMFILVPYYKKPFPHASTVVPNS